MQPLDTIILNTIMKRKIAVLRTVNKTVNKEECCCDSVAALLQGRNMYITWALLLPVLMTKLCGFIISLWFILIMLSISEFV